jgi:cyclase
MRENYLRKVIFFTIALVWLISDGSLGAQDLGRHFQKIRDGIYVYGVDDVAGRDPSSNCGIIITQEGVVLIDSGPNPPDSLTIFKAVQQLTPLPIRFLINTETHNDHTTGNFVFSPPALVIGAAGASAGMKNYYDPKRNEKLIAESNEMREAFRGFRVVTPHIEFNDRMTLNLGERALELIQLKNIHSDADTAIWLPKERVLFSAAVAAVKRFGFLRPFVTIENIKSDIKKLKALQPEIIVPAHGRPTTVQLLDRKPINFTTCSWNASANKSRKESRSRKSRKIPTSRSIKPGAAVNRAWIPISKLLIAH